jgi:hypothetical protein
MPDVFSWANNPAAIVVVPIFFLIMGLILAWIRHGIRNVKKNSQWF